MSGGASGRTQVNAHSLQSTRSTRLVGAARALMALFLSASILIDSGDQGALGDAVRAILIGYTAYALLLLAALRRRRGVHQVQRFAMLWLGIDAILFAALIYLTGGADSPLFSPLVFLILSGTLQWGSRGALAVGLLAGLIFLPSAFPVLASHAQTNAGVLLVVRVGSLTVTSLLLWGCARHVERVIDELSRLSTPVPDGDTGSEPPLEESLRHALTVFGCERGAVLWADEDEPHLLMLSGGPEGRLARRSLPMPPEQLMELPFGPSVFLADRAGAILVRSGTRAVAGPALDWPQPILDALFFDKALVIRAKAEGCEAWIVLTDHSDPANEDLAIGGVVAAQMAVRLDRWRAQAARREVAAGEERLRLARDLHDGVLQFMAGTGLQLEALGRSPETGPEVRDKLIMLRGALQEEQLELRTLITNLRPESARGGDKVLVSEQMTALTARLAGAWAIEVRQTVEPAGLLLTASHWFNLSRMIREAVANAVRHGKAHTVSIGIWLSRGELVLEIEDDGIGFATHGRWTDEQMASSGFGPRSVRERTVAMGGSLAIESRTTGVRLSAVLPIGEAA